MDDVKLDPIDNGWVAKYDAIASWGDTPGEALRNLADALDARAADVRRAGEGAAWAPDEDESELE